MTGAVGARHPTPELGAAGARHPTPELGAAVREQLRAVGLAIRREAAILTALVGIPTLLSLGPGGGPVSLGDMTGLGVMLAAMGLLAPLAVWRGEERFGTSVIWLLPVSHRRHALVKVGAGWIWLLVAVSVFLLWLFLVVRVTGGTFGEETRLVLDASEPSGVRAAGWGPPWWQWMALFAGATALYLLGSALVLATPHPWRWLFGAAFVVFVLALVSEEGGIDWLQHALGWTGAHLLVGPYGLDAVLTGGSELLDITHELPSGETVRAWRALPTLGRWAPAALLWNGVGLAALLAAASRRREGRAP